MKLLFDQHLSPFLVELLDDLFPGSQHVHAIGLGTSEDRVIWEYARSNELTIVTKDADFSELNVLLGYPPKILWIRVGNCTTTSVVSLIRKYTASILQLEQDPTAGILTLM